MPHIFRNYDQAALDAQYNNCALVPNFAEHTERWARESDSARARLACRVDVPYGPSPLERVDIFSAARKDSPLHLFIHGGYWRALDKSSFSFPAPAFVAAGVSYAALNYPLAPQVRMDEIVQCVRRAVLWLVDQAAEIGIDPNRISVSGHSAGGHLVAMIATSAASDRGKAPRAAFGVSLSGLYDLEPIRLSYLNVDVRLDAAEAERNSPVRLAADRPPPLLLAVGARESDEFRRQQRDFASAWRAQGHAIEAHELEGHDHFTIAGEIARPDSVVHRTLMQRVLER